MQVVIETRRGGTVTMELDSEAARAMVASVVFASRFHEGIRPLAGLMVKTLQTEESDSSRSASCR